MQSHVSLEERPREILLKRQKRRKRYNKEAERPDRATLLALKMEEKATGREHREVSSKN